MKNVKSVSALVLAVVMGLNGTSLAVAANEEDFVEEATEVTPYNEEGEEPGAAADTDPGIETLKKELQDAQEELKVAKGKVKKLDEDIATIRDERAKLEKEKAELVLKCATISSDLTALTHGFNLGNLRAQLQANITKYNGQINDLVKQMADDAKILAEKLELKKKAVALLQESEKKVAAKVKHLEDLGVHADGSSDSNPGFSLTTERVAILRLYNPNSSEHFYTANVEEKNNLTSKGWIYEGIGWIAPATSDTPIFRVYNKAAGDHHLTMNQEEKERLVSLGWEYEGVAFYSDDDKGVAVYRQYNPNAKCGSHNYTILKVENDYLFSLGWKPEGIAFYGLK